MVIFPLVPGQTIAQMWSNGARGESVLVTLKYEQFLCTVRVFRHENSKNGRQKVLTSLTVSLLWRTQCKVHVKYRYVYNRVQRLLTHAEKPVLGL